MNTYHIITSVFLFIGIFLILFLILGMYYWIHPPNEKPLSESFQQNTKIDVLIIENNAFKIQENIQNLEEHFKPLQNIFILKHENDLIHRQTLARLSDFILILPQNSLLMIDIQLNDLFCQDNIPYIYKQSIHVREIDAIDQKIFNQHFNSKHEKFVSTFPILLQRNHLIQLIDQISTETLTKHLIFYIYYNYAIINHFGLLTSKYGLNIQKKEDKHKNNLRPFIYRI